MQLRMGMKSSRAIAEWHHVVPVASEVFRLSDSVHQTQPSVHSSGIIGQADFDPRAIGAPIQRVSGRTVDLLHAQGEV